RGSGGRSSAATTSVSFRKEDGMRGSQDIELDEVVDFKTDERLSRGTRAFLRALNSPAPPELEKLPALEARKVLETAQASVPVDYSGIDESERTITADGFQILLNIVRPGGVTRKLPVFMFIHGGGWVLGDYPTHRRVVRDLVVESGYCAVFVNYTRTPDAPFPRQINEIFAATKRVTAHADGTTLHGRNLRSVRTPPGPSTTP